MLVIVSELLLGICYYFPYYVVCLVGCMEKQANTDILLDIDYMTSVNLLSENIVLSTFLSNIVLSTATLLNSLGIWLTVWSHLH